MKKYLVADLVKDLKTDRIKYLLDKYNISEEEAIFLVENKSSKDQELIAEVIDTYSLNIGDAEMFVDDFPNPSTWADVEATAESLGLDITDVEDDDVENYMEMGGINKGELESSVGPIQWLYDNKDKAYMVYLMLGDTPVIYRELKLEQVQDWTNSESMGEYYNDNIRGQIDDSQGCGCNDDPCTQEDIDTFTTKFDSIS